MPIRHAILASVHFILKKFNRMAQGTENKPVSHEATQNYAVVDGLRAFSIILVVIYHCFHSAKLLIGKEQFDQMIREIPLFFGWVFHGDKGVDVFFVISGFLISSMLFKEYKSTGTIRLGNFYWRRMVRLAPIYWVALILFYPFLANKHTIWANFLYINNFLPAEDMFMGWSWSLAVEEQFYLLFPLVVLYLFPLFRSAVLALIFLNILAIVIRFALHLVNPELNNYHPSQFMFHSGVGFTYLYFDVLYSNLYSRFGCLASGCLIGYLHVNHKAQLYAFIQQKAQLCNLLFAASLIGAGLIMIIPHYNPEFHFSQFTQIAYSSLNRNLFGMLIAVILLLSLYPVPWSAFFAAFLSLKPWKFIARLSYSMYLFHLAIVVLVFQKLPAYVGDLGTVFGLQSLMWIWAGTLLALVFTIVVSMAAYYGIERPIMNLRAPAKYHA